MLRLAVPLMAMLLVTAACGDDDDDNAAATTTTEATNAPDHIDIGAGLNDPKDPNIAVLAFMPAEVSVEVGTPVSWSWAGTEPHSVTFLAPGQELPAPGSDQSLFQPTPATGAVDGTALVNSGLQPLGPQQPPAYTLTFAKAGSYEYHCVIHPQMVGTVKVVDKGGSVDTPAAVAQRRAADQAKFLKEGRDAKAAFVAAQPETKKNSDGSTTWTLEMGTSTEHTDILAFQPTPANIRAGDTVTFVNNSAAPHTGSFFGKTTPITNPLDPKVDPPAPGKSPQTLNADDFFNTGLLPPNAPPGAGPPLAARSFTFKVPEAGTYGYVCLLHFPSGMAGSVVAT